jgi:TRAP-type C4-dicarboxylate transport system substrate-binding protein
MKNRLMLAAAAALGLAALLAVSPQDAAAQKRKDLRFVIVGMQEGGQEVSAEAMALNMYIGALDYRIRTYHALKGKYNFKYIHTMFSDANECLMGVSTGAAEMTFSGPHYLEQLDPGWRLGEAPGMFDSWAHFMKTLETPAWKALHEKTAKEKGVTIVKWMANIGDWYLYTNKGPIKTLDDVKGQKIRFAGGEGFAKALGAMGATAISLPYTEVVTALQTNMIDGLLTDMAGAFLFYDLPRYTKYAVPVTFAIQPICMVVNTKWWQGLPEPERKAIQEVFDRVDVSLFFDRTIGGLTQMWGQNPKLELVKLSDEEVKRWKATIRSGAKDVMSGVDPALVEAIDKSR